MNFKFETGNQRGSALLGSLIAGVLLVAVMVEYQRWTSQAVTQSVHHFITGKALSLAETGIAMATDKLRSPASADFLVGVTSQTSLNIVSGGVTTGRIATDILRDSQDSSLVSLTTTAYYYIPKGSFIDTNDPLNLRPSEMAIITALVRTRSVGDFFASVPTLLQIEYGSDLGNASVYARDLVFKPRAGSADPHTRIHEAFYSGTVQCPLDSVDFVPPANAPVRQIEPNLVNLDSASSLRQYYQAWAGSNLLAAGNAPAFLPAPVLQNGVPYNVYYCPGNLTLALGSDFSTGSDVVIYVAGQVRIAGNINPSAAHSVAIVAEGDIVLAKDDTGDLTLLKTTLITGGSIVCEDLTPQRTGALTFSGGFHAQGGANFAAGWPAARRYTYARPPSTLPLPFFLSTEQYRVLKGKFNQ